MARALKTLSECIEQVKGPRVLLDGQEYLQALDAWLEMRGDATISVGVVDVRGGQLRRCTVRVHGRTFEAERAGTGYEATWRAICATVNEAERFEREAFRDVG